MEDFSPTTRRRRRLLALALTVIVLAAGLYASYYWQTSRVQPEVPVLGPNPVTIVPGVHLLGGLVYAAAYAVETSEGLVLIDTGFEADAGPLKRELKTLGLDVRKLKAVLLTHIHGDHTGGAAYLRKTTGATVYAGRGDAELLRAGGAHETFFSLFYIPGAIPHPTPVDVGEDEGVDQHGPEDDDDQAGHPAARVTDRNDLQRGSGPRRRAPVTTGERTCGIAHRRTWTGPGPLSWWRR